MSMLVLCVVGAANHPLIGHAANFLLVTGSEKKLTNEKP